MANAEGSETPRGGGSVAEAELLKLSFDWCKHIATLSTGSILLMVTFREKLAQPAPRWGWVLPLALLGFVAAILGSLGVQFEHLRRQGYRPPLALGKASILLLLGGFLTGIVSLTLFGFVNLL